MPAAITSHQRILSIKDKLGNFFEKILGTFIIDVFFHKEVKQIITFFSTVYLKKIVV